MAKLSLPLCCRQNLVCWRYHVTQSSTKTYCEIVTSIYASLLGRPHRAALALLLFSVQLSVCTHGLVFEDAMKIFNSSKLVGVSLFICPGIFHFYYSVKNDGRGDMGKKSAIMETEARSLPKIQYSKTLTRSMEFLHRH